MGIPLQKPLEHHSLFGSPQQVEAFIRHVIGMASLPIEKNNNSLEYRLFFYFRSLSGAIIAVNKGPRDTEGVCDKLHAALFSVHQENVSPGIAYSFFGFLRVGTFGPHSPSEIHYHRFGKYSPTLFFHAALCRMLVIFSSSFFFVFVHVLISFLC